MRVLINLENTDDIREIYVEENELFENLRYIIEAEFNIPNSEQVIKYENKILDNDKIPFKNYNVKEDEILVIGRRKRDIIGLDGSQLNIGGRNINQQGNNNLPGGSNTGLGGMNLSKIFDDTMKMIKQNPNQMGGLFGFNLEAKIKQECQKLKELYTNNPDELNYLFMSDPELAEAVVSGDDKRLEEIVGPRIKKYHEKKKQEMDEYNKLMSADPNDPEAQRKIEEMIRLKNIDENFQMAQEYLPETLMPVHMLFIHLEINKHKVVALVDTGAQSTIISENLAKKFGIFNMCDTRYAGIAKGVGTSKIIGIIHAAQMKIGSR